MGGGRLLYIAQWYSTGSWWRYVCTCVCVCAWVLHVCVGVACVHVACVSEGEHKSCSPPSSQFPDFGTYDMTMYTSL